MSAWFILWSVAGKPNRMTIPLSIGGEKIWLRRAVPDKAHRFDLARLLAAHLWGQHRATALLSCAQLPANLIPMWDEHLLDSRRSTGTPYVIGEMGGGDGSSRIDRQWQERALAHFSQQQVGVFYYCLNPSSSDTGGLLQGDFTTPVTSKLELLQEFPSTDVNALHQSRSALPPPALPPRAHPLPPALSSSTLASHLDAFASTSEASSTASSPSRHPILVSWYQGRHRRSQDCLRHRCRRQQTILAFSFSLSWSLALVW